MGSLELVDLVDVSGKLIDGLVPTRTSTSAESPHERSIVLEASTFPQIDYVFFRRFKDVQGRHLRSSQVLAYVIDNSNSRWSEDELASCHHRLWLHGVAPLIYVAWATRVDVLSCARQADFWHVTTAGPSTRYREAARIEREPPLLFERRSPAEEITIAANVSEALRRRFSAFRLAEGTFWDDPANQELAKADAAAHGRLIQAIVEADRDLNGAQHPIRRRLLVLMVLIKYLEDRSVFPPGLFGRFHAGARCFLDILRDGTVKDVKRLFRYLEKKFNGDVFSLGTDVAELSRDELTRFATLVGARQLGGQDYFWDLFSFEHIPVEVISRLYQRFVTGHGAVYTPPFLASLILDQVMPYERLTGKEKVLDPACGSGVFLVGAFRRLVAHWRTQHAWREPTVDELKGLLSFSIHGVEVEETAVDLTAFSLALAVCDALKPRVIWKNLKFDKLRGRNLRNGDFFDPAIFGNGHGHNWPEKFDIVVGNPPFQSSLTPLAKAVDDARGKERPPLPDKQAAYLFLEQSLHSLNLGGSLCLIQPHGLLYNRKTQEFRKHLLKSGRLHAILDFVSLRGMYEGADPKTVAWHAIYEPPGEKPISHLTFRRTYSAEQHIGFEIDRYDWHVVTQAEAIGNPFVWRVNLLGGGRLHELSQRLRKMRTLAAFVAEKGPEWDYGEGFIAGEKGNRVPASFLTGKPLLPTRAFTNAGIDRERLRREKAVVKETLFKSPYTESRYSPPLILFKAHESLPMEFWNEGFIAYRDKIIGLHAPKTLRHELRMVFDAFETHKDVYRFCCAVNGSQALTGKATVPLKQDFDALPMPKDLSLLKLSFWEDAIKDDVLTYMCTYVRRGQDSDALSNAAGEADLDKYSALFVRLLGSLYRDLKSHPPIFLNGLIAQPFYFGSAPDVLWLGRDSEGSLHKLVYDQSGDMLRTVRVVRHYDGNVILVVKPDRLRYWIRSTAVWDADETLGNLREQGW